MFEFMHRCLISSHSFMRMRIILYGSSGRHEMGTFSALISLCNLSVIGGFSSQSARNGEPWCFFDVRLNTQLNKQWSLQSGMLWWAVIFHPCFGSVIHMYANRLQPCINHHFLWKMPLKSYGINIVETGLHTPKFKAVHDMTGACWSCWYFTMATNRQFQISMRPWFQAQRKDSWNSAHVW